MKNILMYTYWFIALELLVFFEVSSFIMVPLIILGSYVAYRLRLPVGAHSKSESLKQVKITSAILALYFFLMILDVYLIASFNGIDESRHYLVALGVCLACASIFNEKHKEQVLIEKTISSPKNEKP